jgi:uncharacterized membrane protein
VSVLSPVIFWPCLAGLIVLAIGFLTVRRELSSAAGTDNLIALGPVFFAAPLALFGAEHLTAAKFIMEVVPRWMPGRMFWTYFVGLCLIAAALSLVLNRYVRLSATLLTIMFVLFVAMIHLPNVAANPKDRIMWAIAVRDLSFAAGACALAATERAYDSKAPMTVVRFYMTGALIFFAIEHVLHPQFAPGVPLPKVTPAWFPFHEFLGYLAGVVLFIGGAAMSVQKHARTAATWVGVLFTVLTFFLYLPIMATDATTAELTEGMNYIADTLLFGGAIFLVAGALAKSPTEGGTHAQTKDQPVSVVR